MAASPVASLEPLMCPGQDMGRYKQGGVPSACAPTERERCFVGICNPYSGHPMILARAKGQ